VEIQQTAGDVSRFTKANILRGAINLCPAPSKPSNSKAPMPPLGPTSGSSLYINIDDSPAPGCRDSPNH
jgi:hypothetical protein